MRLKEKHEITEVAEALSHFEGFLRRRGFKVTRTRLLIAERALSMPGHFSAIELWGALRDRGTSVATVYRTLDLLAEAGLVRRCTLAGTSGAIYESCLGRRRPHGHLVCRNCGRAIEFKSQGLETELQRIAEAQSFCLEEAVIQGIGLCSRCRKALS